MAIEAMVFDLDGVVRHFDPAVAADIEQRHGLAAGAILATAFSADLGVAAVTGQLTYEAWVVEVATRLHAPDAIAEWSDHRGSVDPEAKAFVAEVRATGCPVAVLSNATTRLEDDLAVIGLDASFDHVFNTARLGVCKPQPAVYLAVCERLGLTPAEVAFTDDTPAWADAATQVGLHGIAFTGIDALRKELRAVGLGV